MFSFYFFEHETHSIIPLTGIFYFYHKNSFGVIFFFDIAMH